MYWLIFASAIAMAIRSNKLAELERTGEGRVNPRDIGNEEPRVFGLSQVTRDGRLTLFEPLCERA